MTGIVFGKCSFGLPVTGVKKGVPFLASKKPFLGVFCTDRCNFISGSLERPNATYINCLQLITIRDLISELELCLNDEEISTSICIDNQPLLDMIQNGRVKNKQLDIKILKLVEWRSKNQFIYQKVCTKSNLADIFTKALAKPIFKAFTEQFMVDLQ